VIKGKCFAEFEKGEKLEGEKNIFTCLAVDENIEINIQLMI
jgi:hypothetical protein